jgi:hypothetical protein
LWTNRYNGLGNGLDEPAAVAVDQGGNIFVAGNSYNGTNSDFITLAYSNGGLPPYTNRFNGTGNNYDQINKLAVDAAGNVVVTGVSIGSGSHYDFATIKYSTFLSGTEPPPILLSYKTISSS